MIGSRLLARLVGRSRLRRKSIGLFDGDDDDDIRYMFRQIGSAFGNIPPLQIKLRHNADEIVGLTELYPQISREVRKAAVAEALQLLEREVVERTPRGAGPLHLADTISTGVPVEYGQKVLGELGTPCVYGEPVEYGTKPHWPPSGPLVHWAERVLNIHGKEAQAVGFLIARAISRRGTKGAHMFQKGFEAAEGRVMRILEDIPGKIVERLTGKN